LLFYPLGFEEARMSYTKRLIVTTINEHEVDAVMVAARWAKSPGAFTGILKNITDGIAFLTNPTSSDVTALELPPLGIKSIADLVKGIQQICRFLRAKVAKLEIIGHGSPYGMWVGKDWLGSVNGIVEYKGNLHGVRRTHFPYERR
jgi:hypothetical protein